MFKEAPDLNGPHCEYEIIWLNSDSEIMIGGGRARTKENTVEKE